MQGQWFLGSEAGRTEVFGRVQKIPDSLLPLPVSTSRERLVGGRIAHYLPMHTEAHNNISSDDDSDHPAIHIVTKHDFIVGLLHFIKFNHA